MPRGEKETIVGRAEKRYFIFVFFLLVRLCAGLDLGQSLALLEAALLLQPQNLEAVKVGEGLPPLLLQALLVPVAGLPLGVNLSLLPGSLDGTGAGTAGNGDNNSSQQNLGQSHGLPGNTAGVGLCGRAVNQNL